MRTSELIRYIKLECKYLHVVILKKKKIPANFQDPPDDDPASPRTDVSPLAPHSPWVRPPIAPPWLSSSPLPERFSGFPPNLGLEAPPTVPLRLGSHPPPTRSGGHDPRGFRFLRTMLAMSPDLVVGCWGLAARGGGNGGMASPSPATTLPPSPAVIRAWFTVGVQTLTWLDSLPSFAALAREQMHLTVARHGTELKPRPSSVSPSLFLLNFGHFHALSLTLSLNPSSLPISLLSPSGD
ncbi:hypothetical protein TIFTF001_009054 [Ficus carica]|uniref:Uncharacterized protein n=1 Tax=Ficus carica TaxID=3494 RepID=A0AA88AG69_FICCA|nr:hypothetical protein TIFTF001_009054 [Ficus carica]